MSTNFGRYANCIVRPMSENGAGTPLVKLEHVLDAGIVAGIVFFSVLGGDVVWMAMNGGSVLLTAETVSARLLTAAIAFCLTFLAQWARYRGIKLRAALVGGSANVPRESSEDD